MRAEVEFLTADPADERAAAGEFFGRRWALRLGTILLAGLALITLARWRESAASPSGGPETIIQQAVPPEPFPAASRSDATAPDPGDNPP